MKLKYLFLLVPLLISFLMVGKFWACKDVIPPTVAHYVPNGLDPQFNLQCGDILVRPNWSWLPGSASIDHGRKYGHVAIVIEGSKGRSMEEVLANSKVIEALFFDQGTRKFQWDKQAQIRESRASISFGSRFSGNRYRLRTALITKDTASLVRFLKSQLDGGYSIWSGKRKLNGNSIGLFNWHCATLVWSAFYAATGIDLDTNGGAVIYPNDILVNPLFDQPDGRLRF